MGNGTIVSQKKRAQKVVPGLRLAPLDHRVIERIAKEGFLTYRELRKTVLKESNRSAAWRRLRQLAKHGILHEVRNDEGGILGWSVNFRRIERMGVRLDAEISRASAPVYRTAFSHDIILRELKETLSLANAVVNWVPEHVLKAEALSRFHYLRGESKSSMLRAVPDGLLELALGGKRVKASLELELTHKSRKRIYQKFESYITSKAFEFAFFIAQDEKLLNRLRQIYQDVLTNSTVVRIEKDRNGMYFALLSEIQKKGIHAAFFGSHDTITLAELSG